MSGSNQPIQNKSKALTDRETDKQPESHVNVTPTSGGDNTDQKKKEKENHTTQTAQNEGDKVKKNGQGVDEQRDQMVGKAEVKFKAVIDEAAKRHKRELNDIYKDGSGKDQLGFKDSDIREYHEAICQWILDAFDETFKELVRNNQFKGIIDSHRNKLRKNMDMQLVLCIRRQEISLEKRLMQVKLATCQAEDFFDSLVKLPKFVSVDDFNKEFRTWKEKTFEEFHRVLDVSNIERSKSWEYELEEKLKEKEEELKPMEKKPNDKDYVSDNATNSSSGTTADVAGTDVTNQPGQTNSETNISNFENNDEKSDKTLAQEQGKSSDEVTEKKIEPIQLGTETVGSEQDKKGNSTSKSLETSTPRTMSGINDEELTKNISVQQINNQNVTADTAKETAETRETLKQSNDKNRETKIHPVSENAVPKSSEQQAISQQIPNSTTATSNSNSVVQSKQASAKTSATQFMEQEYQKALTETVRSAGSIDNMKNDLECTKVNVGIYLDSSQLLVGAYFPKGEFKILIPGANYLLDMTNKRLELNPITANQDKITGFFLELFKNSQLENRKESKSIFTPEEIVIALLAAVDKKLKELKYRAERIALTLNVDEKQQEMIMKVWRGCSREFRYIPFQSATIIGHYCLQNNLPSVEERKIVARVNNNYLEAWKVTVFRDRVSREVPASIPACSLNKQDGSSGIPVEVPTFVETLKLPPSGGQRFYILEGGNLLKPRIRKNENELEGVQVRVIDDFLLLGLRGVSFLATKEEREFLVFDRKQQDK